MGARIKIPRSRAARHARFLGALSLPVLALTALGRWAEVVPDAALVPLIAVGCALAVLALLLGVAGAVTVWRRGYRGAGDAAAAILYCAPALALLGLVAYASFAFPRLAEVSTDLADPPQFWSIEVPAAPEIPAAQAALQEEAYPQLAPRLYPAEAALVHGAARQLASRRGWRITQDLSPSEPESVSKIEAIASTLVFRFRDAVAIRITGGQEGTRVDMRSASLVGGHDLGENARRVTAFLDELDAMMLVEPPAPEATGALPQPGAPAAPGP